MTSAIVQTEIETAALADYTWSVWESSHTFSFTAALAIHTYVHTYTHTHIHCCKQANLQVENKLNISGYSVKLPVHVLTIKYLGWLYD